MFIVVVVVQIELEKLNTATDNINKYEVELDVSYRFFFFIVARTPHPGATPHPPFAPYNSCILHNRLTDYSTSTNRKPSANLSVCWPRASSASRPLPTSWATQSTPQNLTTSRAFMPPNWPKRRSRQRRITRKPSRYTLPLKKWCTWPSRGSGRSPPWTPRARRCSAMLQAK